jgi:hypothetical protein
MLQKIANAIGFMLIGAMIGFAFGNGYATNEAKIALLARDTEIQNLNRQQTDTFTFLMEPSKFGSIPTGKSEVVWVIQGKVTPKVDETDTAGYGFTWQPKGTLQQGPYQAQPFPGMPRGFMPGTQP